jgi:hypothetical protein
VSEELSPALSLANKVSALYSAFPQVEAIALGGSQTAEASDELSDIDLYVFTSGVIPVSERAAVVEQLGSSWANLNLQFWDPGDEWFHRETGIEVDMMFWPLSWIEDQLDRVLVRHQQSMGYSTCFWYTIQNARLLYDKSGWFAALQEKARRPYPEELRRAIIINNHAVLRKVIPSYAHQIEKALRRRDLVSVNHRVAALLASYFDVLFAINRILNPGEKRLVRFASERCAKLPAGMAEQVNSLLAETGSLDGNLVQRVNDLIDGLDELLAVEGFDPNAPFPPLE